MCIGGERWARMNPYTEVLAPWYAKMANLFQEQELKAG